MTRIDVERPSTGYSSWWWWVIIALIIIGLLIWWGVARSGQAATRQPVGGTTQTQPGQGTQPAGGNERAPSGTRTTLNLNQVLQANNLPRQFTYGGLTWQAVEAGRYEQQQDVEMITIGPMIRGHKLYYEKGTPTKPYQTLYLKGTASGYTDVYVRYKPMSKTSS